MSNEQNKIHPNEPAQPIKDVGYVTSLDAIAVTDQNADCRVNFPGLTIRAELVARAMQGILANSAVNNPVEDLGPAGIARAAVRYADALISELNKTSENEQ